jgi:hypothetical protein
MPKEPISVSPTPPRPAKPPCEHRRTEKRRGKTYCKGCRRQLYL